MFITDAHCDTLRSIGVDHAAPESCAVTAQRLAQGGVGLQTFAMFAGGKGPAGTPYAVSYTHLDVYKRQVIFSHMLYRLSYQGLWRCGRGSNPRPPA